MLADSGNFRHIEFFGAVHSRVVELQEQFEAIRAAPDRSQRASAALDQLIPLAEVFPFFGDAPPEETSRAIRPEQAQFFSSSFYPRLEPRGFKGRSRPNSLLSFRKAAFDLP